VNTAQFPICIKQAIDALAKFLTRVSSPRAVWACDARSSHEILGLAQDDVRLRTLHFEAFAEI
jgi:hypothetical protein